MCVPAPGTPAVVFGSDGYGNSVNERDALCTKGDFKVFQPHACLAGGGAENTGLVVPEDNATGDEPGLTEE